MDLGFPPCWSRRRLGVEKLGRNSMGCGINPKHSAVVGAVDIVSASDLDLDTLGDRLHAEANQHGCPFMLIPFVTAWANKPIA